ncbi:MAG: response regulator [Anaerolineales bacterium]
MTDAIRLLIADDHTLFREGLHALLEREPDVEVVGEAESGAEAVELAAVLVPDVVLMDIQMPDLNGIEATRRVTAANAAIGVIVVTMLEDDSSVFAAMRAGARGYVLKGARKSEMLRAIQAAANGEALFGPAIAARMQTYFADLETSAPAPEQSFPELTEREHEILDLIAQGLSNAAIAERLSLSSKTVSNHVSNIYGKLQVADRLEAYRRARAAGMGDA